MNKSKKLLIVPRAGHEESYYMESANYQQTVLQFWKEFDPETEDEP